MTGDPCDVAESEISRQLLTTRTAKLRRRTMLAFAAVVPACAVAKASVRADPLAHALRRIFGRGASIREFGRKFRTHDANAATRLLARLDGVQEVAVRTQIDALRKEDFSAGRVVVIDGWVLARAEAEACAFVAAS